MTRKKLNLEKSGFSNPQHRRICLVTQEPYSVFEVWKTIVVVYMVCLCLELLFSVDFLASYFKIVRIFSQMSYHYIFRRQV